MTNYYYYRKNWGQGELSIQLNDSPGYPDDPLYDEIAVDEGHTLPGSSATDGSTMDDLFILVIWSGGENPGSDPSMEVVSARRTTHPRVFQIVDRGLDDTPIGNHPVGSYVGMHYTALVSYHDLQPIQAILDADVGSIFYTWTDVFDRREIGILPPGINGQVLHTAGSGQPPYWDWVYGYAARTFRIHIYTGYVLLNISMDQEMSHTIDATNLYTEYTTDSYDIEIDVLDSSVDGSIGMSYTLNIHNLSGDSSSEPVAYGTIEDTNLYTEYETAVT